MNTEKKSYGEINFDAYNASKGGLTHDGKPIPPWSELTPEVRAGWSAGARAVIAAMVADALPKTEDDDVATVRVATRLALPRSAE